MAEQGRSIEHYRAEDPPGLVRHGESVEAAFIRGNMGGLVVIKLSAGTLEAHEHEQEHVGVVLEGQVDMVSGDQVVALRAGDLYRIPPHVAHAIRCHDYALIVQARA